MSDVIPNYLVLILILSAALPLIFIILYTILFKGKLDAETDTVCLQCGHEFNRISADHIVTIRCPECNSSNLIWRKKSNENLHDV